MQNKLFGVIEDILSFEEYAGAYNDTYDHADSREKTVALFKLILIIQGKLPPFNFI